MKLWVVFPIRMDLLCWLSLWQLIINELPLEATKRKKVMFELFLLWFFLLLLLFEVISGNDA